MADSGDSTSGWPGFVGQLNKTFMLVRDLFGYALPGGVFLAIGLICGRYSLFQVKSLLYPYELKPWAAFIAVVAACYVVGDAMAAIVYMPISVWKYVVWQRGQKASQGEREWLRKHPTEVTAGTLEIRVKHPELLYTLDRRETLNVMGGSTAAALLTGWCVFCRFHWSFRRILFWGGIVLVVQFTTGLSHLWRVRDATLDANVPDPAGPNFGTCCRTSLRRPPMC